MKLGAINKTVKIYRLTDLSVTRKRFLHLVTAVMSCHVMFYAISFFPLG